jgi:predicted Rossmann-fold nucleotide-binding protein
MLEALTNNDIGISNKPIFIFNCNNIFDSFIKHINILEKEGFITRDFKTINTVILNDYEELANKINEL